MNTQVFKRIALAAAIWNIVLGIMAMLGWILDIGVMTSGFPGHITMKFNTAIAVALSGFVLFSNAWAGTDNPRRGYEKAAAILVLLLGLLTLAEYVVGENLGIDQFFFEQALGPLDAGFPGRMAPNTAFCLVLIGMALLLLDNKKEWAHLLYQSASIILFFIAFASLVGYLYDAVAFFTVPGYATMAIHTATGFGCMAAGLLALNTKRGIGAILAQDNFSGASLRMLLPMTMIAPMVLGWFRLAGQRAGYYSTEFGLALMVTLCVVILSAFALWNARFQGIIEASGKRMEMEKETLLEELKLIKVELEERVQLRTRELNRTLAEREILLQEVHHRVKNNLQVISSLINMQLRTLKSDAARPELEECRSRIFAISFIHQQLYQSKNYSDVAFPQYARQLIGYIAEAAGVLTVGVSLQIDMDELPLSVDKAIPCGLILNELITNSFKHAFPGGRCGRICVEWKQVHGDLILSVEDDGVGMSVQSGEERPHTLGLMLVNTLAEQLGGRMEFKGEKGTRCSIRFPEEREQ